MNYDTSISDQVNLSRVLDEMIMEGTELETIVQFLRSHEKSIPEIYANSAFAYDLYDLGLHPYRVDEFLVEHINQLPTVEFCFAINSLATFLKTTGANNHMLGELKEKYHGVVELVRFSNAGWDGARMDDKFVEHGETNLVEWLSSRKDIKDFKSFVDSSFLAMSAFQSATFLQLPTQTQYLLFHALKEATANTVKRRTYFDQFAVNHSIYGKLVTTLLRQLLVLDNVTMFNWVVNVLDFKQPSYHVLKETVFNTLLLNIPESIKDKLPTNNIWDSETSSFPEIVFEMNLVESQFEPYDLFIFMYLFETVSTFEEMKENTELFE